MMVTLEDVWALIELRRIPEAERRLADVLASTPNDPEVYYAACYICWIKNDYEQGLEHTEDGLALAPDHSGLLYARHQLLVAIKIYSEAEQIIIGLLQQAPENPDYLCAYGRLMLSTLHLDKARALCTEAIRISPDHKAAQQLSYQLALVHGDKETAEKELSDVIRDAPDNRHTLIMVVQNLIENHRYKEAERVVAELIRLHPDNEEIIDIAISLRVVTHWTSTPNWPFNRFGWPFSIGLWLSFIALSQGVKRFELQIPYYFEILMGYLAYVVYSWVQPMVLKRWLKWRGL